MKKILSTILAVVSFCVCAQETWNGDGPDYSFGSLSSPLSSGEIAVPADGVSEIGSLSFFPSAGSLLSLVGGSLAFSSGGRISVASGGAVRIASPVSGSGDISFSGGIFPVDNLYPGVYETKTVLSSQMDVSLLDVVSAELKSYGVLLSAFPYHGAVVAGERTVQLQAVDGTWIKCAKIELASSPGSVTVRFVYRRYADLAHHSLGVDFDAIEVGDTSKGFAGDYRNVGGLSALELKSLSLMRNDLLQGTVLAGAFDIAQEGVIAVQNNANVCIDGGGTPAQSDVISSKIRLDGRLVVKNRIYTDFAGGISGSGALILEPWTEAPADEGLIVGTPGEEVVAGNLITNVKAVIVKNASVASITNVTDVWIRTAPTGKAAKATICAFVNTGKEVKFQAQIYDGGYVKCAIVSLFDSGSDIAGCWTSTPYYSVASKEDGEAFLGTDITTVAWTGSHGNYHPVAMRLHFFDRTTRREFVLSSSGGLEGGRIEVGSGVRLILGAKDCLPSNGVVTVFGGGEIEARVGGISAAKEEFVSVNIGPGGVFRQKVDDVFAHRGARINVDGGELALKRGFAGSNPDCGTYFNRVVLSGGARASGLRARIGSNLVSFKPNWHIRRGTSAEPVKATCGFTFVGVAAGQKFTVSVDDFAEGCDFITCPGDLPIEGDGALGEYSSKLEYRIPICKKGVGTWYVGAASPNYHAKISIVEGELALGVNDAFASAELLSLEGGCLTATNSSAQTILKLAVTSPSSIVVDKGSSISVGEVSNADWGGRLTVSGDFAGASPLRIGTSAVLTAQQLGCIRINRHRALQDENGYLYPLVPGPVIIVR